MSADPRLLDVASRDSAIAALENRLAALPEAVALAEATQQLDEAKVSHSELSGRKERAERDSKRFEDEASNLTTKLAGVGKKLHDGSVTNPRELQALQAEQEMLERKHREVEDLQLEVMMLLEDLAPNVEESSKRLEETEAAFRDARAAHDAVVGELETELQKVQEERASVSQGIDEQLLSAYDKVRRRNLVGAAALDGDLCTACHMKLTTPEVTEVKASKLGRCPSCDVILVVES